MEDGALAGFTKYIIIITIIRKLLRHGPNSQCRERKVQVQVSLQLSLALWNRQLEGVSQLISLMASQIYLFIWHHKNEGEASWLTSDLMTGCRYGLELDATSLSPLFRLGLQLTSPVQDGRSSMPKFTGFTFVQTEEVVTSLSIIIFTT